VTTAHDKDTTKNNEEMYVRLYEECAPPVKIIMTPRRAPPPGAVPTIIHIDSN
jgi:hypothetical protein